MSIISQRLFDAVWRAVIVRDGFAIIVAQPNTDFPEIIEFVANEMPANLASHFVCLHNQDFYDKLDKREAVKNA